MSLEVGCSDVQLTSLEIRSAALFPAAELHVRCAMGENGNTGKVKMVSEVFNIIGYRS